MSENGEEIINRLPDTSGLHKNIDARRVIENTIGAWFDYIEEQDWFNQFFLDSAKGPYLDLHGQTFDIKRKIDESDEDYRNRIIYEGLGHLTVNFLLDVYGVELYSYVDNFTINNTLVSDNPYYNVNGFFGVAPDDVTKEILNKKFVLRNGVTWL